MTAVVSRKVVIHRGPIPGTSIGHHWFEAGGRRYGISGSPHGINHGWSYEIVDDAWHTVDDSCFSFHDIREWAAEGDEASRRDRRAT